MKKGLKGFIGFCLAAVLVVGSVGSYAYADSNWVSIVDSNGNVYKVRGNSTIGKSSGSAYTESVGTNACYCSVSATFTWYDRNRVQLYSNGNGAGGMHGAGVTMSYPGDVSQVYSAAVSATHIGELTTGGSGSCTTSDSW